MTEKTDRALLFWIDYDDGNILAIVPFSRNCVYYTIQPVITQC